MGEVARVGAILEDVLEALPAETPEDARVASTVAMCARLAACDGPRGPLAEVVAQAGPGDDMAARVGVALTLT